MTGVLLQYNSYHNIGNFIILVEWKLVYVYVATCNSSITYIETSRSLVYIIL